jgi:UDP-glucose 4-epimerase
MVVPTFVRQALDGVPLTVYGTGQQKRCFCSAFDVVEGLIRLPEVEEATGMVVNLGSQNEISIENLARRVVEVTGSSSGLCYVPYEEAYGEGFDDMFQRIPDLARARQLVGWDPRYGIDDIIRQVADDLRRG